MNEVLFASAKVEKMAADATLPAKFQRMLDKIDLRSYFDNKTVAIKMHVGNQIGYTTIHPLFVKILVDAIKAAGGRPFITDGSWSIPAATVRGYTQEVLGAPILPAAGSVDKYFCTRPVKYRSLESADLCGNIVDADAMLVLSHGKGHGQCGFGGAIKNIAMGCVTVQTRGALHSLMDTEFSWNEDACVHCYICRENCPGEAISFDDQGKFNVMFHNCRYCMHCVDSCPEHAISINLDGIRYFQEGMSRTVKAVLDTFQPNSVFYINVLMNITPFCDCWGFTTPSLVPDIGIMASPDIVAIEQASLDAIDHKNYIPDSLPEQLEMTGDGHLLQRIHRKDPYLQVETAAELGLGSREYQLVEVD
ncbi:MAG: DUF362 domain-containing protein [Armatimonadetes bacterium]|nr:DUF362 domain-containing protein [Armatimonadota bacterium]NIM24531.1 DUF362 domain-containing protein [Armatimonadota bacterium]NIM68405.1 DUF362 domain-containing protein [Armatimonadota bacterium]NIM76791.1 DUF362 domain-containing protein [Armatimonadota bacterium]NIN06604.1 DUF362 domain-containing protein [Armatimonadota bacterium]